MKLLSTLTTLTIAMQVCWPTVAQAAQAQTNTNAVEVSSSTGGANAQNQNENSVDSHQVGVANETGLRATPLILGHCIRWHYVADHQQ